MSHNRIPLRAFSLPTTALESDASAVPLINELDKLLGPLNTSRDTLRRHLFMPTPGNDRVAQMQFEKYCTDTFESLLTEQDPIHREELLVNFIKDIEAAIKANPKLDNHLQHLLMTQLSINTAETEDSDRLISRIIVKGIPSTEGIFLALMTRKPGNVRIADKFVQICKEQNLIQDPEIIRLIRIYLKAGEAKETGASFVKNLIAATKPSRVKMLFRMMLLAEMESFAKRANEFISIGDDDDEDEDYANQGSVVLEDNVEVQQTSAMDLEPALREVTQRITSCQNLLLELYDIYPGKQFIKAKEISSLVKSIAFDKNQMEDLIEIQEQSELESDIDLPLNYAPDFELAARILNYARNSISAGETQYTKELFIRDLKYLIEHNIEFSKYRYDLLTDCFGQLLDQDEAAAKDYAINILQQEKENEPYISDDIKTDLFSMLGADERLTELLVKEANGDTFMWDNIVMLFEIADVWESAYPPLQAMLNDPSLDLENFISKFSERYCKAETSYESEKKFNDFRNILCKQFNWDEHSLLSTRMEEYIVRQQDGEMLDISELPQGKYRQWLEHIYQYPQTNSDPNLN